MQAVVGVALKSRKSKNGQDSEPYADIKVE